MSEPWEGGCVLVTGGTGLVGHGILRAFLRAGAACVAVGSTEARAAGTAAALGAEGRLLALAADLTAEPAIASVLDRAEAAFGPVRVLVNGAGITFAKPLATVTAAELQRVFAVNVQAAFLMTRAAGQRMAAAGQGGRVVNITSGNYRYVRPDAGLYCASKAALEMLTRSFALEFGPAGITVNAVAPGLVERTDATDPGYRRVAAYYRANSPLGHVGTPEDTGAAVLFLASARARSITGETLVVDAGYSAGRFDFPRRDAP